MTFVKLETLGGLALFYGWTRCYALSNPRRWGYDNNFVYYVTGLYNGYKKNMGDKKNIQNAIHQLNFQVLPLDQTSFGWVVVSDINVTR